jgi:hypothetical protein
LRAGRHGGKLVDTRPAVSHHLEALSCVFFVAAAVRNFFCVLPRYRFLQRVPDHYNIGAVLGVMSVAPLTAAVVDHFPEFARKTARHVNARTGKPTFLKTTGLLLELLPRTLEQHVRELGADLSAAQLASLGAQLAAAQHHLYVNGVVHCDLKLNNIMVDPAMEPPRLAVVDFGCAVVRGDGAADMDDAMNISAVEATCAVLGNPAHLAPEVQTALQRKVRLARGSAERVVIPLAGQPAFELGAVLFEMAMGLDHPLGASYPAEGTTPEEFAAVDYAALGEVAGAEYVAVVRGLLAFEAAERMPVGVAHRRLAALVAALSFEPQERTPLGQAHSATADAARGEQRLENVARNFLCPITLEVMDDPVICPEGHSFERRAIMQWLTHSETNPVTRNHLTEGLLFPNRALRESIATYYKAGGGRAGGDGGGAAGR